MLPAQSTLNTMLKLIVVIALVDTSPINLESALKNAEPMKSLTLPLTNASASKDLEESVENVPSAQSEALLQLMEIHATTVEPMNRMSTEPASANKDLPATQQKSVLHAAKFLMDSFLMDSAQSALDQ